jgi:hypothetical protein
VDNSDFSLVLSRLIQIRLAGLLFHVRFGASGIVDAGLSHGRGEAVPYTGSGGGAR